VSNQLKMAMIEAIVALHRRGWSQRRIAQSLGVDRQTVARYLAEAKPARVPAGSDAAPEEAKPAGVPAGSDAAPSTGLEPTSGARRPASASSLCEPWRAIIEAKLAQRLSAQRIYQDLVTEHGFPGKYPSVRRFVRRLVPREELPYRRLECGPGEEAQVDFGQGAWVEEQGRRYRPHVFRIVLSYSRKAYSEVVRRQSTEAFLRCLENAWWHFGGVPERVVLDNLRAAVRRADWFDPELNPQVRSFGQHYGVTFLPTKPYTPRHKGKVERGVDYVQENALKGRVFGSLQEQNRY
jgi:transposase